MKLCHKVSEELTLYVSGEAPDYRGMSFNKQDAVDIKDAEIVVNLISIGYLPVVVEAPQKVKHVVNNRYGEITD